MTPSGLWRVDKKEWEGERCFILGGGASVLSQNMELIRGQKIIAINTSFESLPFPPDFIIFSDSRWWNHNNKKLKDFKGRIVSTSSVVRGPPPLLRMHRKPPRAGLADDVGSLAISKTTLSAAINLAVHLGIKSIVLLGIDGKAINGKTHHHSPHPWKTVPGCWETQKKDLALIAQQLVERGIECVNASPDSSWNFWPKVRFEDVAPCQLEQNSVAA